MQEGRGRKREKNEQEREVLRNQVQAAVRKELEVPGAAVVDRRLQVLAAAAGRKEQEGIHRSLLGLKAKREHAKTKVSFRSSTRRITKLPFQLQLSNTKQRR